MVFLELEEERRAVENMKLDEVEDNRHGMEETVRIIICFRVFLRQTTQVPES